MPTTRIGDLDVYHEAHGSGEAVLLIHGLGSSTADWAPQVEALAPGYTVHTYDVRGHGRSGKPRGRYTVQQFARDAAGLIEHLALGPVHVVGLSMGGMIGFQLAADRPELVRSLVIVNSGPEMLLRRWRERLAILQRRMIVRMLGMRTWGSVLADRLLPGQEHAALRTEFVNRWARNDKSAYLRALSALVGWSVTARLPGIGCPVLVVAADQDYTPVALKEQYTALMPHARLAVIANSRHMMPIERPAEFHDVLLPFLAGQRASRGVR
ncbi:MAG: Beta-ketoadipate enol-lactone hydrolase [Gemmatimonadetes bacterium]|jgi:3-oxoadipate enol-lactonase|nr:Beta-ketoadipate enol-lactone hydrolase [Gemmatimonadota bacterium]